MNKFFDIPLVTSRLSKRKAFQSFSISFIFLFFLVPWIIYAPSFERGLIYAPALFILLGHSLFAVFTIRNIFFVFRYTLIAVLTLGTIVAWQFMDDVFVAPFGVIYQTHEATVALVGASLLALIGSHQGWCLGRLVGNDNLEVSSIHLSKTVQVSLISLSVFIAYSTVFLYVYKEGGFVSSSKSYGFDRRDIGVQIGILNQIILYFTSLLLILLYRMNKINVFTIFVLIGPGVIAILSGNRADFLMQTGIVLLLCFIIMRRNQSHSLPIFKLVLLAAIMYFLTGFISVWRNIGDVSTSIEVFLSGAIFIKDRGGIDVLTLATGNQMLSGFYAVYSKINLLNEQYLFGSSYVDYLIRLPPGFMGFDRPEDLALQMTVGDTLMQQGGIYEITEAFWNFGYLGVYMVPLLISFLISILLNKCYSISRYQLFYLSAFFVIGLSSPRAIWYQNFVYIRLLSLLALIMLFAFIASLVLRTLRKPRAKECW